jgi:hypothetical protein
MQQITIAMDVGRALGELPEQVLLCDADGRALGFFSPLPGSPSVANLQLDPPLSVSEIEELRKSPTGRPLSEILAGLGLS